MMYGQFINMPNVPFFGGFGPIILLLGVWDVAWKGYGMWKAGRNNEPNWFVAILLLNTIGILPILYIYLFAKDAKKK